MNKSKEFVREARIKAAIRFAEKAHAEVATEVIRSGGHLSMSDAPEQAWARALPELTSREAVVEYIACIAAGMAKKLVHPVTAKQMLYTAQLALAAFSGERQ